MIPPWKKVFPNSGPGTAKIVTTDGKVYKTLVEYPKGDPENPLSWEELIEKFHEMSGGTYKREQRLKIIDQVRGLERIDDFQQWSPLLLKDGLIDGQEEEFNHDGAFKTDLALCPRRQ